MKKLTVLNILLNYQLIFSTFAKASDPGSDDKNGRNEERLLKSRFWNNLRCLGKKFTFFQNFLPITINLLIHTMCQNENKNTTQMIQSS